MTRSQAFCLTQQWKRSTSIIPQSGTKRPTNIFLYLGTSLEVDLTIAYHRMTFPVNWKYDEVISSYSDGNRHTTMTSYSRQTITEFLWEIKNLVISILLPDWLHDENRSSYNNWIFMWINIWYIFELLVYDMSIKSAVLAIHISLAGVIYEATQMSKKNYSNWMLIFRKPFF